LWWKRKVPQVFSCFWWDWVWRNRWECLKFSCFSDFWSCRSLRGDFAVLLSRQWAKECSWQVHDWPRSFPDDRLLHDNQRVHSADILAEFCCHLDLFVDFREHWRRFLDLEVSFRLPIVQVWTKSSRIFPAISNRLPVGSSKTMESSCFLLQHSSSSWCWSLMQQSSRWLS
jgi:hypothetical protein